MDLETELRAALRDSSSTVTASESFVDQVLHEARAATTPHPQRSVTRRRRRVAALTLAVCAFAVPATGLAVATGPLSYRDAFDWMFTAHVDGGFVDAPIDPATVRRDATGPGPDGLVFSVVSGKNATQTCLTPLFETAESALHPVPTDVVVQLGGGCRAVPSALPFGRSSSLGLAVDGLASTYECAASEAVRAEIRADATGQTYPVLITYGRLFAWLPTVAEGIADVEDAYTITGYAADGHVVAQGHLFDFTHYDEPGGRIIGPVEDENGRIITDGRTLEDPS